jgi:hypothetical protein
MSKGTTRQGPCKCVLSSAKIYCLTDIIQQQYFSYIVAVSCFIGGGKPEYSEKITDLSLVTDEIYHIMLDR